MIGLDLMIACAPNVAPETMQEIIRVESSGNPLAVNVNTKWLIVKDEQGNPVLVPDENGEPKPKREKVSFKYPVEIKTAQDAVTVAHTAIAAGHTVDLGLTQVNSSNLKALGYRVEEMFEPCKNIAAGARILTNFYSSAKPRHDGEQAALQAALSAYNTGSFTNGFNNGYVARYGVTGRTPQATMPAINPYTADSAVIVSKPQKPKEERDMQEITETVEKETVEPVISQSADDANAPGVQVEYDPEEAEASGAFEETAITEQEAWESNADLAEPSATGVIIGGKRVREE